MGGDGGASLAEWSGETDFVRGAFVGKIVCMDEKNGWLEAYGRTCERTV